MLFAFLCGSIPTGYLLVKHYHRKDIRKLGSGNIGSTNVMRNTGLKLSKVTQVIDILKGLIPVAVTIYLSDKVNFNIEKNTLYAIMAIIPILGHDYTPFLGFRGGKGVNTTVGSFLLLAPVAVLISGAMFYLLRLVTPIFSIRSIALSIILFASAILLNEPFELVCSTFVAMILIVIRHKDNLERVKNKTEA
jgi:glycerol-3-phosphate acyltransferase PlsY